MIWHAQWFCLAKKWNGHDKGISDTYLRLNRNQASVR